jgi:thiamine biosynthesis lipoprotein
MRRWAAILTSVVMLGFLIAGVIAVTRSRATRETSVTVVRRRVMLGTQVAITVVASDEAAAEGHIAAAFKRVAELEQCLSSYRADSEVTRLNAQAARAPVAVSEDLFRIVSAGVQWHRRTRGAFDITVAPLLDLWKQCGKENRLPTPDEIARARALLGADRIELNVTARTVRFPVEGMRIDLGGLGKGYIADEAAKVLKARGVRNALAAMGGDICALGTRGDGRPWRLGIQDPRERDSPGAILGIMELSDRAVSTAGNYERYVVIQGRHYSHIVDPRTGLTAEDVPSVTVVGPDTLTTDVMDTALSVLGIKEGQEVLKELPGVEAMFITIGPNKEPHFTRSPGFAAYEAKQ